MGYVATFRGFWACLKMGGLNPHAKHMAGESMINHDFQFFFAQTNPDDDGRMMFFLESQW